jgi:hypothetical protein
LSTGTHFVKLDKMEAVVRSGEFAITSGLSRKAGRGASGDKMNGVSLIALRKVSPIKQGGDAV